MQANQANVTFNTHEAVKALKSSGFDEKQAESVVETINKAVNETVATKAELEVQGAKIDALRETVGGVKENIDKNMATKADLAVLTKTVEGIQENMATQTDLAKLETRMMRMMWLQLMAMLGMFVTMVVALP